MTREWLALAQADFSDQVFPENVHFAGYIFPGPVIFANCAFSGGATFDDAQFEASATLSRKRASRPPPASSARALQASRISTSPHSQRMRTSSMRISYWRARGRWWSPRGSAGAGSWGGRTSAKRHSPATPSSARTRFDEGMRFDSASFNGAADFAGVCARASPPSRRRASPLASAFTDAELQDETRFSETRFDGDTSFERVEFEDGTLFRSAVFAGNTSFEGATLKGWAGFGAARFAAPASFSATRFEGGADFASARFARCPFPARTLSRSCRFRRRGVRWPGGFRCLRADSTLTLAETSFPTRPTS